MARFRKADIEFHYDGREAHAAVNVKLDNLTDPDPRAVALDMDATEAEAEEFAAAWSALDDEKRQGWYDLAAEDGWRRLEEDAAEIFGKGAEVYGEGRSGGWAVVNPGVSRYALGDRFSGPYTEEEVAAWDALAVAKWGKFSRYCADAVADIPYQAMAGFYLNRFEPDIADRETARRFTFYYDVPANFGAAEGGAA